MKDPKTKQYIAEKEEVPEIGDDGKPTGRIFLRKKDSSEHDCEESGCTVNPEGEQIRGT